jgi:predicted molibdopterin-dependent oxidoreductase YjgC
MQGRSYVLLGRLRSFSARVAREVTAVKKPLPRLTEPLVRDRGALRPATWDEALDRAAAGIRASVERHGPRTFGLFSCSKATNEVNFVAQKLARVAIGSNNIDSCNRT